MLKNRLVRSLVAVAAVAAVGLSSGATASAGGDYPPNTDPPEDRTLDVSSFAPVCQNDVPYIQYSIVPIGFESVGPATLTIRDINGNVVQTLVVEALSGQIIYPGASADAQGVGTDWPGYKLENGVWVIDTSDAILREGLSIEVEVNPTATATVGYPPATSACAGPDDPEDPGAGEPGDPDDPSTSGVLPSTGSNATMIILLLGTGLLGAGIVTSVAMRRRHASVS